MTFMEEWHFIWDSFYDLVTYKLSFPEPIGSVSSLDMGMFWAIAYMMADSVMMISSRRD